MRRERSEIGKKIAQSAHYSKRWLSRWNPIGCWMFPTSAAAFAWRSQVQLPARTFVGFLLLRRLFFSFPFFFFFFFFFFVYKENCNINTDVKKNCTLLLLFFFFFFFVFFFFFFFFFFPFDLLFQTSSWLKEKKKKKPPRTQLEPAMLNYIDNLHWIFHCFTMGSIHLYFARKQVGDTPKRGKPEMRSSCRNSLDLHWSAAARPGRGSASVPHLGYLSVSRHFNE